MRSDHRSLPDQMGSDDAVLDDAGVAPDIGFTALHPVSRWE